MSKEQQKQLPKKERPANYNEKLVVNGTFLQVMKAAVKDANKNTDKKKP